jgi:ABC-type dipeptide/oligopeptide/nickel transport system permease subunit
MLRTEQVVRAPIVAPGLPPAGQAAPPRPGPTTPRGHALLALAHDPSALLGLGLFLCVVLLAVFADQVAPYDPAAVHMRDRLQLPSATYLVGTDELGRDLLSRLIYGARVSLAVGVIATGIAAGVGIVLGLASGIYGGKLDSVVMRALDGLLAFPAIILALAIISALGPSPGNAMIAIGVVSIPTFARITRGTVLALKEKEFVEAARACGATAPYLMLRVLLPNCLSPLLVQASIAFANAILTEAALSFLGLGVQPPTPSWGSMLDTGRKYLDQTPWYSFSAGAAIFLAVLSLNLVGDGLRDALDPRIRRTVGR